MKSLFASIIFLLIGFSCSEKKSNPPSNPHLNPIETTIDLSKALKKAKLSEITKEVPKFIFLETSDSSLIGRIDKVIFHENLIYILDVYISGGIFVFDSDGKFVKKLSSIGDGPNQYKQPLDFFIENDRIWVLDNGRDIKEFSLDGKLIQSNNLKLPGGAIKFQKAKNSPITAFISGEMDDNLIVVNEALNLINSKFPYINRDVDMVILNSLFTNYNTNNLIYRRNFNDTLFQINEKGDIIPYKYINYGNKTLDIKTYLSYEYSNIPHDFVNKFAITKNYWENNLNSYIVFTYRNDFWINIHDKRSQKSVLFKYDGFENDITFEKESFVIGTTEEYLIFQVDPQNLKKHENKFSTSKGVSIPEHLFKKVAETSSQDNPILMLLRYDLD